MIQAKKQRKAQREANNQPSIMTSTDVNNDDDKMLGRMSKEGSQSVASIPSTAGTMDGKTIGHLTIEEAREHEQMLIKVVQGQ